MTKEEKIIATAFTRKMFIDGSEIGLLYEYMEKKVGHGVIDLMLANKGFWEELQKACEQDFIDMVSKEQPSLPANLDEASEKFAKRQGVELAPFAQKFFKAGAEWMAGQGETQEHFVIGSIAGSPCGPAVVCYTEEFAIGDEVIVQIRKKQ